MLKGDVTSLPAPTSDLQNKPKEAKITGEVRGKPCVVCVAWGGGGAGGPVLNLSTPIGLPSARLPHITGGVQSST